MKTKLSKTIFFVALFMLTAGLILAAGQEVTLKGEVVDLQCFMAHHDTSKGAGHAKCAEYCMNKGLPVGLLTADKQLYVLLAEGHDTINAKAVAYAGKSATVKGVLLEQNGVKAIQVKSLSAQ